MRKLLMTILILGSLSSFGQSWTPTTYNVGFGLKMMGFGVKGSFKGLKATLKTTGNDITALTASVDANTVNTNNSLRDTHLKEKPEFFEPAKFPTLNLASTQITKLTETTYMGTFNVTIKSVIKSVKIPFSVDIKENAGVLKANFTINRQDWKFGGNTTGMSDNVSINLLLNIKK